MKIKIEIRSATPEDEVGIKQLLCSLPGVWQKEWRDNAVSVALKSARDLALIAINNEEIIGFMSCHDVGFRAYLSEMVISESHQKKGIGTLLLKRAENILANRGCQLIVADVYPPAIEFYRKNGWTKPKSILLARSIGLNADNKVIETDAE